MDGDRPMPAAAVAAVLGDDDLLCEILLHLVFPTCLVHAALVSKRWLLHASDPAFLRRLRDRNPPRLLGFCLCFSGRYRFVPFPQPPELAAPIRRSTSSCAAAFARRILPIKHCRNGRLIIEFFNDCRFDYSLAPLLAGEAAAVLPTAPLPHLDWDTIQDRFVEMFLPEDGGRNGITLLYLWAVRRRVYAKLYVLGSGGWGVSATAVTEVELSFDAGFLQILPPIHGKVFVVTGSGYTLGLNLAAASFFTLELPVGVSHNYKLSCAEDSGLYLVSVDGFQLSVWLHRMSGNGNGAGWLLVDTFCVREGEACARLVRDGWIPPGDYLDVVAIGDNADFVFLDHTASGVVFYVHLRSRVVEKVHQRMPEICWELPQIALSPVAMIWPPVFPARDVGHDQDSRGMTPLCLIL